MSCEFEILTITVLPFVYEKSEWLDHPSVFLKNYVYKFNLKPYSIVHTETENGGLTTVLTINGKKIISSSEFRKRRDAVANIIILTLLNIFGYYETAQELQHIIAEKIIFWDRSTLNLISKNRRLTKSEGDKPVSIRYQVGLMINEIIKTKNINDIITVHSLLSEIISKYGIIVKKNIIRRHIGSIENNDIIVKTCDPGKWEIICKSFL